MYNVPCAPRIRRVCVCVCVCPATVASKTAKSFFGVTRPLYGRAERGIVSPQSRYSEKRLTVLDENLMLISNNLV